MLQRQSLSLYRTWQRVDSLEDTPYTVTSISCADLNALVPGRLNLLGSRLDVSIIADVHEDCLARGQFLRVYTIGVEGRGVGKPPKSREGLSECAALMLTKSLCTDVKNAVAEVIGEHGGIEDISTKPWLLNNLWEHPLFRHIDILGWKSDLVFARTLFRNVHLYAFRDISCISHLACQQAPSIGLADVVIKTPHPRRIRLS